MNFFADFHVHSKYSRATSGLLDLEHLYMAAQLKGITVIGTGDFTHPAWFEEIQTKLVAAEDGLFTLRPDIAGPCDEMIPSSCRRPVRFMLITEISNIYKKEGKTRKNHNLIFLPEMEAVRLLNRRLEKIGNIVSDGRPILGLDSRDLLEIVLETAPQGFLVPAHIWTPWFSLLGSKSGFDSVSECFGDLTDQIFAVETGLSSDPLMNRRVSSLDSLALISNSDAHSPSKVGREANIFNTALNYGDIRDALKTADPDRFLGTIEFYPEEGKYHLDGHRKCGFSCPPSQTHQLGGRCPVCGRQITLGVLYRVDALADRAPGIQSPRAGSYHHLIPLENVLAEVLQVGPMSKKVTFAYEGLLTRLGSEFEILHVLPKEELMAGGIPLLPEAIERMRSQRIHFDPGYDGEFGRVKIFSEEDRDCLLGQRGLFKIPNHIQNKNKQSAAPAIMIPAIAPAGTNINQPAVPTKLNEQQKKVIEHESGPLLVIAGPGTGKTRSITCRIASLIQDRAIAPDSILAMTFTQKAAQEMTTRLNTMISSSIRLPLVTTLHGFCWQLLKESFADNRAAIITESARRIVLGDAIRQISRTDSEHARVSVNDLLEFIVSAKQHLIGPQDDLSAMLSERRKSFFAAAYKAYQDILDLQCLFDFEDLIYLVVRRLQTDESWRIQIQNRFKYIFIDEFQDINLSQYRLIGALSNPLTHLCAIGDPDQAIYGFRGSDWRFFIRFMEDYPDNKKIVFNRNYRSTETILEASYQVVRPQPSILDVERKVFSGIHGMNTITVFEAASAKSEAVLVGKTIESLMGGIGFHSVDFGKISDDSLCERSFSDFAILYRTNAQGVLMADMLTAAGIPCQLTDHRVFQEKPLIARVSALLRLMADHACYADLHLLLDIVSPAPAKSIFQAFKDWAYAQRLPLRQGLQSAFKFPIPGISVAGQHRLVSLLQFLQHLIDDAEGLSVVERIALINARISPTSLSQEDEDLRQLLVQAQLFGHQLEHFLAFQATQSDTDLYTDQSEKVTLLTMHAAKGLEFPIVFIAGCEDGLIPFQHASGSVTDVEEERRLFFVAMTRARQQLILTWARKRNVYGKDLISKSSPFLENIKNLKLNTALNQSIKPQQLPIF